MSKLDISEINYNLVIKKKARALTKSELAILTGHHVSKIRRLLNVEFYDELVKKYRYNKNNKYVSADIIAEFFDYGWNKSDIDPDEIKIENHIIE